MFLLRDHVDLRMLMSVTNSEMVLDHNVTLSNNTVVMYVNPFFSLSGINELCVNRVWISSEDAAAVAEKGFRIVHSPSNFFYLVC